MNNFASRLKELRTENKLTQRDLAKAVGLSQNAINMWENNNRVPNANAVISLAKYFNVTTDYILGLED